MSLPKISSSTLSVPSRLDHLRPVLVFARALAEWAGYSSREQTEIELAVEEVFSSIVEHGYERDSLQTVQIVFEITAVEMSVTFLEKGIPFDMEFLPQYRPDGSVGGIGGLGVYLARKVVDEVTYDFLGRDGNRTRLVKRKKHTQNPCCAEAVNACTEVGKTRDTSYQTRRFRPADALMVSRCAYRSYGYSYHKYVYDPAHLVAENAKDSLSQW